MAKRGRKKGVPGWCMWCGIKGHHRAQCWVMAERRYTPDQWDYKAQELVEAGCRDRLPDLRRRVANALRAVATTSEEKTG